MPHEDGYFHPALLLARESGLASKVAVQRELQFTASHARKLQCRTVLNGHQGCVNRLAWNAAGTKLASCSDDSKVLVWSYPDTYSMPLLVETQHRAIIFGVQFLPMCGDSKLVSGGMDFSVQLHELPPEGLGQATIRAGGGPSRRHAAYQPARIAQARTSVYTCHMGRVKDVEVEPMNPHNFWSVGEDGYVRQFDTRIRHAAQCAFSSKNVLFSLSSREPSMQLELKSLDLCKSRPHLMAVACEDPYVRLYDRRKLSLTAPKSTGGPPRTGECIGEPVLQLAPAHLQRPPSRQHAGMSHTTYVSFSTRGDRLVASYHGDQAYCFDVSSSGCISATYPTSYNSHPAPCKRSTWRSTYVSCGIAPHSSGNEHSGPAGMNGYGSNVAPEDVMLSLGRSTGSGLGTGMGAEAGSGLPAAAEAARVEGNRAAFDGDWALAVEHLSRAVYLAPWSPALWLRRADALLSRNFPGDALWALHDADNAFALIQHNNARRSNHVHGSSSNSENNDSYPWRAQLTRAHALKALGQPRTALDALAALTLASPAAGSRTEVSDLRTALEGVVRDQHASWVAARQRRHAQRRAAAAAARTEGPDSSPQQESHSMQSAQESDSDTDTDMEPPMERFHSYMQGQPTPEPSAVQGSIHGQPENTWPDPTASADHVAGGVGCGFEAAGVDASPAGAIRGDSRGGSPSKRPASQLSMNGTEGDHEDEGRKRRGEYEAMEPGLPAGANGEFVRGSLCDFMPGGKRLLARYVGHSNVQTDIKECCFLGWDDQLVAAGSDDGRVFIYDSDSGELIVVLQADEDVANCVQPHPHECLLATSGIESVITLWGPGGTRCTQPLAVSRDVKSGAAELQRILADNQSLLREAHVNQQGLRGSALQQLAEHPHLLRLLLGRLNSDGPNFAGLDEEDGGNDEDDEAEGPDSHAEPSVSCRVT